MAKRIVQIEIESEPKNNDMLVYSSQSKCYKQIQKQAIFAYQDQKIKALEQEVNALKQYIETIETDCNDKINKLAISIKTLIGGNEQ